MSSHTSQVGPRGAFVSWNVAKPDLSYIHSEKDFFVTLEPDSEQKECILINKPLVPFLQCLKNQMEEQALFLERTTYQLSTLTSGRVRDPSYLKQAESEGLTLQRDQIVRQVHLEKLGRIFCSILAQVENIPTRHNQDGYARQLLDVCKATGKGVLQKLKGQPDENQTSIAKEIQSGMEKTRTDLSKRFSPQISGLMFNPGSPVAAQSRVAEPLPRQEEAVRRVRVLSPVNDRVVRSTSLEPPAVPVDNHSTRRPRSSNDKSQLQSGHAAGNATSSLLDSLKPTLPKKTTPETNKNGPDANATPGNLATPTGASDSAKPASFVVKYPIAVPLLPLQATSQEAGALPPPVPAVKMGPSVVASSTVKSEEKSTPLCDVPPFSPVDEDGDFKALLADFMIREAPKSTGGVSPAAQKESEETSTALFQRIHAEFVAEEN